LDNQWSPRVERRAHTTTTRPGFFNFVGKSLLIMPVLH
jgi:hypothetical protein